MRRFFFKLAGTEHDRQQVEGPDAKHIRDVLRLNTGDGIELVDGTGDVFKATILAMTPRTVEVSIVGRCSPSVESPVRITVAQAMLKGKKADTLIRHLTELGMAKWISFVSERSIPRTDPKKMSPRLEKWKKITRESIKQCKRSVLPEIEFAASFEDILEIGQTYAGKIIFHESGTHTADGIFHGDNRGDCNDILAMFGPEGGFSDREIEMAACRGFSVIAIGPRTLRAETAAIAGTSLLQYIFGDMRNKILDIGFRVD